MKRIYVNAEWRMSWKIYNFEFITFSRMVTFRVKVIGTMLKISSTIVSSINKGFYNFTGNCNPSPCKKSRFGDLNTFYFYFYLTTILFLAI